MDSGSRSRCSLGRNDASERNLVVHLAAPGAAARAGASASRRRDFARWPRRAEITARVIGAEIAATAAARTRATGAVEQRQLAAKPLQHHFGRVAVLARLILPFARLQRALDENFRALLEILLGDPAQILIENDDAMPLGLFLALARGLVLPGLRGGKAQIRHRPAVLGATNFRIGAQIADQNHLVDASRHRTSPFVPDITDLRFPT